MKYVLVLMTLGIAYSAEARYGEVRNGYMTYWKSCDGKGTCSEGDTAEDARSSCNQVSKYDCQKAVRVRANYRFQTYGND